MANEKRLIGYYVVRNKSTGFYFRGKGANRWGEYHNQASIYRIRAHAENTANWLNLRGEPVEIVPIKIVENPTVDTVPVDEIRVDFMSLCLVNQEAILNVSICGKPNEVKLPFSKEVAEVVHGRWLKTKESLGWNEVDCVECSICHESWLSDEDDSFDYLEHWHYCPNCGAKMDGDGND